MLLAGEKISENSADTDFILRNIYKAVLGAGDAMMIAEGEYRWQISERLEFIEKSGMPETWKAFYREAVAFKHAPHREQKADMTAFWNEVRDFFQAAVLCCAGEEDIRRGIFCRCCKAGEVSPVNYAKYCIKSRSLKLADWKYYTIPPVAVLVCDIHAALNRMPEKIGLKSKLYQHWLIFN